MRFGTNTSFRAHASIAWPLALAAGLVIASLLGCEGTFPSGSTVTGSPQTSAQHILFVGDSYLSALVIFQQVTGTDVRTLGSAEKAAVALGISPAIAAQLQVIAYESVTNESATPINQSVDPCTLQG